MAIVFTQFLLLFFFHTFFVFCICLTLLSGPFSLLIFDLALYSLTRWKGLHVKRPIHDVKPAKYFKVLYGRRAKEMVKSTQDEQSTTKGVVHVAMCHPDDEMPVKEGDWVYLIEPKQLFSRLEGGGGGFGTVRQITALLGRKKVSRPPEELAAMVIDRWRAFVKTQQRRRLLEEFRRQQAAGQSLARRTSDDAATAKQKRPGKKTRHLGSLDDTPTGTDALAAADASPASDVVRSPTTNGTAPSKSEWRFPWASRNAAVRSGGSLVQSLTSPSPATASPLVAGVAASYGATPTTGGQVSSANNRRDKAKPARQSAEAAHSFDELVHSPRSANSINDGEPGRLVQSELGSAGSPRVMDFAVPPTEERLEAQPLSLGPSGTERQGSRKASMQDMESNV